MSERDIEREEEAQKITLARLLDQFKERERQELNDIELALTKMMRGTYGICEGCRGAIAQVRLEVLPTTGFCRRCASEIENKQKNLTFPA